MPRYIDAEEVKHIMNEYIEETGSDVFTKHHILDFLYEADSKDIVKIAHAKWEQREHKMMGQIPCCSQCGWFIAIETPYCPHCGARMDGK